MTKIEKIDKILSGQNSVYVHALGNVGNGMRIDPDKKCYLTKYIDEYPGRYYGQWDGTKNVIDGRRKITKL